jgi:hypothetical protein
LFPIPYTDLGNLHNKHEAWINEHEVTYKEDEDPGGRQKKCRNEHTELETPLQKLIHKSGKEMRRKKQKKKKSLFKHLNGNVE